MTKVTSKKEDTKTKKGSLRLPQQFKPERGVFDSAFHVWVQQTIDICDGMTEEMLVPTQEDLELVSKLAYQTDEIGTQLAAAIIKDRSLAKELDKGLKEGSHTLENAPKVLLDFLDHYENIPDWAYVSDLNDFMATMPEKEGPSFSPPTFLADGLAMAAGFFVGANYPSVGKSLTTTGSVKGGTMRMKQTMDFVDNISDIAQFQPHGDAVVACAKVRLAHGFARHIIEKKGTWDKDYYGDIISDFDNMIFMSGILLVEDRNKNLDERILQSIRIQLSGVQYLLGAPKELVCMSPFEAKRFFTMVVAHLDDSPDTASQVVEAFINNKYFRPDKTWQGKLSKEASFMTANLITRLSWGNEMADSIGLKETVYGVPLAKIADTVNAPPKVLSSTVERLEPLLMQNPVAKKINPLLKKAVMKVVSTVSANFEKSSGGAAERKNNNYQGSQGVF